MLQILQPAHLATQFDAKEHSVDITIDIESLDVLEVTDFLRNAFLGVAHHNVGRAYATYSSLGNLATDDFLISSLPQGDIGPILHIL